MADPVAPVAFSAAHKVVIDALGFLVAERVHHPNRDLVLMALADALPDARATGQPTLDKMILAAVEVDAAARQLRRRDDACAGAWALAQMAASDAFAEFSLWRLSQSTEAHRATLATDGAAK